MSNIVSETMLNAITSYLWGAEEEDCENAPVLGAGDQADCNPESQDSGDWIIVHPAGKGIFISKVKL